MLIREECAADDWAINDLTVRAFKPMSYSDGTEAQIIRLLRQSGHLTLSLVAEEDGSIIGHVAFSPIAIDGIHDGWFGLGPGQRLSPPANAQKSERPLSAKAWKL